MRLHLGTILIEKVHSFGQTTAREEKWKKLESWEESLGIVSCVATEAREPSGRGEERGGKEEKKDGGGTLQSCRGRRALFRQRAEI